MSEQMVTLTEDLWDRRDPNRPAVFLYAKGASIPAEIAAKFGLVPAPASKARREEMVEDKAMKPAATKAPRSTKKA